ncbi:DUF5810 domain-containing protein [Natronomonas marina]|uniref:DUF5810 domain-containing protein n=1 Tax=Natronomonas marina TaxID=2961939 RepID=UPI0020C98CBD|nr:DUF5810 domain-containing protein [Natronomonas marina]
MGYACPVCSDPQADTGHLANHLAFTAMLGDEGHEAWLEEHAPDWGEMGESELADAIADGVEETEFPQVFEDTAGGLDDGGDPPAERSGALFEEEGHDHDHGHGPRPGREHAHGGETIDEETEAILEEAREMTREMLGDEADEDGDADETGSEDNNG